MRVVYDGSFEGFLTLVHDYYYKSLQITQISKKFSGMLFDEIEILTDERKAQKVLKAIKNKLLTKDFNTIKNIFLCDTKEFETHLLSYIILGFKNAKNLKNINHPSVFFINELEKEYFRVVHRMKGFIRFEEVEDGTLYTKIDTKFNILYYLGKHFINRLGSCEFIIHDIKREYAFVHSKEQTQILHVDSYEKPTYSKDEEHFQRLWKVFFQSVTIQSRENKKLQQQLVPLIYREHMSEFH